MRTDGRLRATFSYGAYLVVGLFWGGLIVSAIAAEKPWCRLVLFLLTVFITTVIVLVDGILQDVDRHGST